MEIVPVRRIGDGTSGTVLSDKHSCDRRRMRLFPLDRICACTVLLQGTLDQLPCHIRAQKAQDPGVYSQFGKCKHLIYCFSAHIQGTGLCSVSRCRNRLRIKTLYDRINKRGTDTEHVIFSCFAHHRINCFVIHKAIISLSAILFSNKTSIPTPVIPYEGADMRSDKAVSPPAFPENCPASAGCFSSGKSPYSDG